MEKRALSATVVVDFRKGGTHTQDNVHVTSEGLSLDREAQQGVLTSDPIQIPIAEAVVAEWSDVSEGAVISLQIRTSADGGHWSSWTCLGKDAHQEEGAGHPSRSRLVFVEQPCHFLQYRVTLVPSPGQQVPTVRELSFHFLNSGSTPSGILDQIAKIDASIMQVTGTQVEGTGPSKPPVVSRAVWCPDGCTSAAPEHTNVTHIIVHHTADSGTTDYPAWVRAIYAYHTEVNKWPDIGYNYLIDPHGTIYEGRAGGDDVIGYHFSCVNANTLGVALLGTFDTALPTAAALNSLKQLVAWKCSQRGLDPFGTTLHPPTEHSLDVISGHRDANGKPHACSRTDCPGQALYDLLPSIRTDVASSIEEHASGDWVGHYGAKGFCLAAWTGEDYAYFPRSVLRELKLEQGQRYTWGRSVDSRALEGPDHQDRVAATFYDDVQLRLHLNFAEAFADTLHLYMLDYDRHGRRQAVIVEDGSARSERVIEVYDEGAWLHVPVTVLAGGSVTVTIDRLAGPNALLSGVFLGGAGAPPLPDQAPQGKWLNIYGTQGFCLPAWAGEDYAYFPRFTLRQLALERGGRYAWGRTTDPRALEGPNSHDRVAATFFDDVQLRLRLDFAQAYRGNLHLYMLDYDQHGRRQIVRVNDGLEEQVERLTLPFDKGAWLHFPVSVTEGQSVHIDIERLAGPNALLAGLFLGEGGPPPLPDRAPQGDWVNRYGADGFCLAAWGGSNDVTYFPKAVLSLDRGQRYSWGRTIDIRALESPDEQDRVAATFFDDAELAVRLYFREPYSGNLHLYMLDYDRHGRRQVVTVDDGSGGQVERLTLPFDEGAWLHFPVDVGDGGSVLIKVERVAGPNALLAGVFLGGPRPPAPRMARESVTDLTVDQNQDTHARVTSGPVSFDLSSSIDHREATLTVITSAGAVPHRVRQDTTGGSHSFTIADESGDFLLSGTSPVDILAPRLPADLAQPEPSRESATAGLSCTFLWDAIPYAARIDAYAHPARMGGLIPEDEDLFLGNWKFHGVFLDHFQFSRRKSTQLLELPPLLAFGVILFDVQRQWTTIWDSATIHEIWKNVAEVLAVADAVYEQARDEENCLWVLASRDRLPSKEYLRIGGVVLGDHRDLGDPNQLGQKYLEADDCLHGPPKAIPGGPYIARSSSLFPTVMLDGSASSTPWGDRPTFQWEASGASISGSHTSRAQFGPAKEGSYEVKLRVTTAADQVDEKTTTVTVEHHLPPKHSVSEARGAHMGPGVPRDRSEVRALVEEFSHRLAPWATGVIPFPDDAVQAAGGMTALEALGEESEELEFEAGLVGSVQVCYDFCTGALELVGWIWCGVGAKVPGWGWVGPYLYWEPPEKILFEDIGLGHFDCGSCAEQTGNEDNSNLGWGVAWFPVEIEPGEWQRFEHAGIEAGVLLSPHSWHDADLEIILLIDLLQYLPPAAAIKKILEGQKELATRLGLVAPECEAGIDISGIIHLCRAVGGSITADHASICGGGFLECGFGLPRDKEALPK